MGPGALNQILKGLPRTESGSLIVGYDSCDDACAYCLPDGRVMLQTVDFFPPMVDDPFAFGQIAAANALSDIYAMGAHPSLAMNLLCVPEVLPPDAVRAILAGGTDKVREAGAVLAGGHTIRDSEPKYGLCVTGFAESEADIWQNGGTQEGDVLILTKPIGSGVLSTAHRRGMLTEEQVQKLTQEMAMLNRVARDTAHAVGGVHACTDVTGFGLAGHACETAEASGVTLHIAVKDIPLMPRAKELCGAGIMPGGAARNREYLAEKVKLLRTDADAEQALLFDPQTSGGLLLSVDEKKAQTMLRALSDALPCAAVIGYASKREDAALIAE